MPLEHRNGNISFGNGPIVKDDQFVVVAAPVDQVFVRDAVFYNPQHIEAVLLNLITVQFVFLNGDFRIGEFFHLCFGTGIADGLLDQFHRFTHFRLDIIFIPNGKRIVEAIVLIQILQQHGSQFLFIVRNNIAAVIFLYQLFGNPHIR